MNEIGNITFKCPQCGEGKIERSLHDRKVAAPYKCPKCGFEGPN